MKKLSILEETDNKIVMELYGEDHTLANLLAKTLIRQPHVKYASYRIDHPLVSNPIVVVITDGKIRPRDAIKECIVELLKLNEEFREEFKKVLEL